MEQIDANLDDTTAFPALTRAKQRFLARQQQTTKQPTTLQENGVGKKKRLLVNSEAATERSPMLALIRRLCIDLDDDVASLTAVVDGVGSSIRRDHQELTADLETLTTRFLHGNHPIKQTSGVPLATSRRVASISKSSLKKKKPKRVVVQYASPSVSQSGPHLIPKQKHVSRAALLALQAVHAHVVQHHFRRYLYTRLYRQAGKHMASLVQIPPPAHAQTVSVPETKRTTTQRQNRAASAPERRQVRVREALPRDPVALSRLQRMAGARSRTKAKPTIKTVATAYIAGIQYKFVAAVVTSRVRNASTRYS